MRKANFKDILIAEQKIELETCDKLGKWYLLFSECMNILMCLSYLECEVPPHIELSDYSFYYYAKESYIHAPFSFRSVSILLAKGQYLEALNLCRSIIENLVNCKYLFFNKDKAQATLKGKPFGIKDRWESIAGKGAYEKIYKLLCKIEHKNFGYGNTQPRINAKFLQQEQLNLIPTFEQHQAGMITNYILFLLYGYLNLSSLFFSYKTNQADLIEIVDRLHKLLKQQKDKFPESTEWYAIMRKITDKKI